MEQGRIEANFTLAEARSSAQRQALEEPDLLLEEFAAAIFVAVPIYNLTVPEALKLWVDQVARVGRTFNYTVQGTTPILPARLSTLVVYSGGRSIDSDIDFATPYIRHVLGFLGLTDVSVVKLDRLMFDGEGKIAAARADAEPARRENRRCRRLAFARRREHWKSGSAASRDLLSLNRPAWTSELRAHVRAPNCRAQNTGAISL